MTRIEVLDHGYVEAVEFWGSDERIIEAARMSTGKGFLGWGPTHAPRCGYVGMPDDPQQSCTCGYNTPGDEKLLRYLYENAHSTPFEMAGAIFEVKAPIMVLREWHRHRTQGYAEMSARYTPLPDENYIPTVERLLVNSKTNKQAGTIKGADELTEEFARTYRAALGHMYKEQQDLYEDALKNGVPKELARLHLPIARYTRMRATANLRNWLGFLTLREAPNAQFEIRQFAHAVGSLIAEKFPRTYALYVEGRDR